MLQRLHSFRLLGVHLSITYNLQVGCLKHFRFPHFQLDNDRLMFNQSVRHSSIKLSINRSIDISYRLTERSIISARHSSTVKDQLLPESTKKPSVPPQNSDRESFLLFWWVFDALQNVNNIEYTLPPLGCRRTAYVTGENDHARRLQYLALTSAILQT